jgi:uncharacterized membrane protein YeiB
VLAAALLIVQRRFCIQWLRAHEQGPVERLWRMAAYRSDANR